MALVSPHSMRRVPPADVSSIEMVNCSTGLSGMAIVIGTRHGRANDIAARLRSADPPVVTRVVDDRVALDLRSVAPEDDEMLARAVTAALAKER